LKDLMQTWIHSNQNLLLVTQLLPYMQTYSWCGRGLQEVIQQNLQQNETYHLLYLSVLQCWNRTETNNDSPKTQTSGDIGINRIMELDPGPMANDDHSNRDDSWNCDTSIMCYDLALSSLNPSDHMISALQQGHQTFPLVKVKDSISNVLGHAYHSLSAMVPFLLDHTTFDQTPDLHSHTALIEQFHIMPSSN
jgi:hypothetical protein